MTENPTDRVSHEPMQVPAGALAAGETMRIDTWLWATRHVKSRSQATSAARAGHVKINGESVKAAQKVRVGDEVRLRVEGLRNDWVIPSRNFAMRISVSRGLGWALLLLSENVEVGVRRRKSVAIWRNSVE